MFTLSHKINSLAICFALLILLLSGEALASQKVDETLEADLDSLIQIEHVSGSAKIIGWENAQVKVEGTLGDDTEEFIFERNGKSIEIRVEIKQKSSWGGWNSGSVDGDKLVIYVPKQSRVEYDTTNADVELENIEGGSDIEVVNGDIDAKGLSGRVQLESVNGDINAKAINGDVRVETVNGDIELEQVSGRTLKASSVNGGLQAVSSAEELYAETVNGDIEFTLQEISAVDAQTVNGSIELSMSLQSGAVVKAGSVGGSITLHLPKQTEAKFDIEAHAGGSIRNRLTADKPNKAEYGPRSWLSFNKGSPDATVDITTVHGTVVLTAQ
ncbi:DUF4097 domain-containing protein [Glaciecola siphonariae]|uniref:DUF4097 domain-containing protein n=1 Tax=Glaciecola siphonariae TaxID=521012 RepID=A0ABV9LXV9_9ALTE